ncbi:hypothetical protein LguiB_006558 [Lonicera macranthoides]
MLKYPYQVMLIVMIDLLGIGSTQSTILLYGKWGLYCVIGDLSLWEYLSKFSF